MSPCRWPEGVPVPVYGKPPIPRILVQKSWLLADISDGVRCIENKIFPT